MQAEHFDQTLSAFRDRTPFRPFIVELVNGNRVEVDHPGALVVRDGVAVFVASGGRPAIIDHEGISQVTGDL